MQKVHYRPLPNLLTDIEQAVHKIFNEERGAVQSPNSAPIARGAGI